MSTLPEPNQKLLWDSSYSVDFKRVQLRLSPRINDCDQRIEQWLNYTSEMCCQNHIRCSWALRRHGLWSFFQLSCFRRYYRQNTCQLVSMYSLFPTVRWSTVKSKQPSHLISLMLPTQLSFSKQWAQISMLASQFAVAPSSMVALVICVLLELKFVSSAWSQCHNFKSTMFSSFPPVQVQQHNKKVLGWEFRQFAKSYYTCVEWIKCFALIMMNWFGFSN